jgi:hypothetical protein
MTFKSLVLSIDAFSSYFKQFSSDPRGVACVVRTHTGEGRVADLFSIIKCNSLDQTQKPRDPRFACGPRSRDFGETTQGEVSRDPQIAAVS